MKYSILLAIASILMLLSCIKPEKAFDGKSIGGTVPQEKRLTGISEGVYYNKVLGLLIGSAIGDAMGAPTEMWSRKDIRTTYGFVNDLDSMVRFPSAEGTWVNNLPAGGTTDDTRWKKLFTEYAIAEPWPRLKASNLAKHIIKKYKSSITALKSTEGLNPHPYEDNLMKMAWLQEWALVADAYARNDMVAYSNAVSKFYGGEMTCAGMLYSPLIGACLPADPAAAYAAAYDLSIFDIGYARDITALVAGMVSQAFDTTAYKTSVPNIILTVDPQNYFRSRLVGRASYRYYQAATAIVSASKDLTRKDIPKDFKIPGAWQPMDSLYYLQLSHAYSMLDTFNEDMPFHAAEIYLITITSMMYCDYDFERTMEFIVNYGRDNDTVAAVAGSILGAFLGADQLPEKKVRQILQVNKELLGTDLEEMARTMTAKYLKQR
ncbi:MAG: ADP-ribosylglycohydrolase family protein [Cyclobacteriaceae bacterium]|nr:ADP-ribosylglycohydrolase family protein [Cyclobacteriaceae bacterium]